MARYSIDTPECPRRCIATHVDGTLYYIHTDHPGSTVFVTSASGQKIGCARYDL